MPDVITDWLARYHIGAETSGLLVRLTAAVIVLLVCLVALFLVYGGIAKGGLDWEPSKLESEAATAEQNIDAMLVPLTVPYTPFLSMTRRLTNLL